MTEIETVVEEVLICQECGAVLITTKGTAECCDQPMENAGWTETIICEK
jgi:hypothetical protein